MTQAELVTAIGNTLTQMDNTLMDPTLINQPAKWQQVYAMRKHLDDQQRALVSTIIQTDDARFQALTSQIQQAIKQFQQVIDNLKKVDSIINTIAQISADLDEILKVAS